MNAAVIIVGYLAASPFTELPVRFWGITPESHDLDAISRSKPKHTRAVVLIHGLLPRPIHPSRAEKPDPHSWQEPQGELVSRLAETNDVFGVSYAQTLPVETSGLARGMREAIRALKKQGYNEIVLVGHSAGGLLARHFVETFPESGVTKLITVATPHAGSGWTKVPGSLWPKSQIAFIRSLSEEYREETLKLGAGLPNPVAACCIVCKLPRLSSDAMVPVASQWPEDWRRQGVPAVLVRSNHFEAMTGVEPAKAIVEVVNGKLARWTAKEVEQAERVLLGDKK